MHAIQRYTVSPYDIGRLRFIFTGYAFRGDALIQVRITTGAYVGFLARKFVGLNLFYLQQGEM